MYFPTVLLSIPNSLAIWLLFILIDVPSIRGFNLYKSFTDSIFISVITSLLIINEVLLLLHDNSFVHFFLSLNKTTEYQISEINTLLDKKQKELIKLANKGQDYEHLADEIDELRDKRQTLLVEDASLNSENERINELIEFIRKNKFRTLEYDDKLVRKIIQNVTVYEEHFVISFKSGIEMEI